MSSLSKLIPVSEAPGLRLRTFLSIASSAVLSFLILFAIIKAQRTELIKEETTFVELRSVVLPSPPPPLPQTQEEPPDPSSLLELDADPTDNAIQVSYSVVPVTPVSAPPVARPVFNFSPDAFKPSFGTYGKRHIYSRSEVDQPPVIVYKKTPEYNFKMMGDKRAARISLMYIVNSKGKVESVFLVGSGGERFDEVVMEAVRQWRFKPAVKDGERVDCWVRQRVVLKGSESKSRFET